MAGWEPNQCPSPGGVDFPAFILKATLLTVGGVLWSWGLQPPGTGVGSDGVMAVLCLSLLIDLGSIVSAG